MKIKARYLLVIILILATGILTFQLTTKNHSPLEALPWWAKWGQLKTLETKSPSMSPEAQTSRLTSHLLIKKIDELRERAVYLQHREEGKWLVDTKESNTFEANDVIE